MKIVEKIKKFFESKKNCKLGITMDRYSEYVTEEELKEIMEEAKKPIIVEGRGVTCMIPNKYPREYTDYYLNQLADFFEFDFFKAKPSDLKLESNQEFKSILGYATNPEPSSMFFWKIASQVKRCINKDVSIKRFEDMQLFDGLILNTKRHPSTFGFIIDKEKTDEDGNDLCYEFVCFYNEYDSFFDHLNGIKLDDYVNPYATPKQYANVLDVVMSWFNSRDWCVYATDMTVQGVQDRHLPKLKELERILSSTHKFFKDNDQFKLEDHTYVQKIARFEIFDEMSIYEYHLLSDSMLLQDFPRKKRLKIALQTDPEIVKKVQEDAEIAKTELDPEVVSKFIKKQRRIRLLGHYRRKHIEQTLQEEYDQELRLNGRKRNIEWTVKNRPQYLNEEDLNEIQEKNYDFGIKLDELKKIVQNNIESGSCYDLNRMYDMEWLSFILGNIAAADYAEFLKQFTGDSES